MKKLLLPFFFCLSCFVSLAQPTLTSDKMLPFGSTYSLLPTEDFDKIDTTIKGANAVWDFSNMEASGPSDLNITIVNPASTPYASKFPDANYAFKEGPNLAYRYFDLSEGKMERVGNYAGGLFKTYNDPQIEYVFPLTLGSSNEDTWDNDASSFGGNYNLYCIGYGTLKLPGKTYENALMVRADVDETIIELTSYFWYSADNGVVLLQYVVGDGFFISTTARYIQDLVVSTGIANADFAEDVKYNNPVDDMLNLSFKRSTASIMEYSVINAIGEEVLSGNFAAASGDQQQLNLETASLNRGIYFLKVKAEGSSQTIKFVKN